MQNKIYNGHTWEELKSIGNEACETEPCFKIQAVVKAIAEACTPRWISVKERLPDEGKEIWVLDKCGARYFTRFTNEDLFDGLPDFVLWCPSAPLPDPLI